MVRDAGDANGKPMRTPGCVYDLPYVKGTGFALKTGDQTGMGWHPSLGWPKTYEMFGHRGRHNTKAENQAMRSLGNKWRRK